MEIRTPRCDHRVGRQVHAPAPSPTRALTEALKHAGYPHAHARQSVTSTRNGRYRGDGAARRRRRDPGARRLRRARHRGQDQNRATHARRGIPISASAWACSSRWSSSRATCRPQGAHSTEFERQDAAPGDRHDHRMDQAGVPPKSAAPMRPRRHHAPRRRMPAAAGTRAHESLPRRPWSERHRHRYEFNNNYRQSAGRGLTIAGTSVDDRLVEIVELPGHPWFIGVQFHPEFKSTSHDRAPGTRGSARRSASRRDDGQRRRDRAAGGGDSEAVRIRDWPLTEGRFS